MTSVDGVRLLLAALILLGAAGLVTTQGGIY